LEVIDHTRLDHLGVQGQKHQFGIEARTGLDRSLDSPFDCGSKPSIVGMRESVATEHAVSDDFCRGTVEVWRRFAVLDVLPQQADGGELDGLRHKIGVQIDRAKCFVELAQLERPSEQAKQAKRKSMPRHKCFSSALLRQLAVSPAFLPT